MNMDVRKPLGVLVFLASFATLANAAEDNSWARQQDWRNDPIYNTSEESESRREPRNVQPFSPGSHNLSIDIGQIFLTGDLKRDYTDSLGFQAHYTYGVSDLFGFDSSIGYSSHAGGDFSMLSIVTGLRMNLAYMDKVIPYINFGLGFYKPTHVYKVGSTTQSATDFLFGIHFGPGVNLQLTKSVFFGAGLTFHNIFSDAKSRPTGLNKDIGGTFFSFLLNAGYTF